MVIENYGKASFGILLFLSLTGFSPARPEAPSLPPSERHTLAHSHNDYEQARPLQTAMDARVDSVEADVWYREGELQVGHWDTEIKGELVRMYLEPLQKIVDAQGSVYGNGKAFYLWIELKESSPDPVPALFELLNRYSMFTQFTDTQTTPGAVTVILTGDEKAKKRYVETYPVRRATRDDEFVESDDPPADLRWNWYAINWFDYFSWNGYGEIPFAEQSQLDWLVRIAHAKGRKLRIFGAPEEEDLWNAAITLQVDMLGTDQPARLRKFIDAGTPQIH